MTPPANPPVAAAEPPALSMPGPLVLRLIAVAALVVVLASAASVWLVSRAAGQEAMRRVVGQQTDEVEVVARLLASKIEQSQKVLRTVALGITPGMLESSASLDWLLQRGLPAVGFFDALQVARKDGELRLNIRSGQVVKAADLDPVERDALRRTLIDGKPLVSELIAGRTSDARILFTLPLHSEEGAVLGVVAGALKLQSQGLLPQSMALPAREDSRLIVFTRDGTILSHTDPVRIMGHARDEPGLAPVFAEWQRSAQPVVGRGATQVQPDHIVSVAGMPLPQWFVARVSNSQALLAPLQGAQREAWWLAAGVIALGMLLLAAVMAWMAQPLAQLCRGALQMLRSDNQGRIDWPGGGGEVGTLVRAFEGLEQQKLRQDHLHALLGGQFQAILENASVGIVISRHGILEVVGLQACLMLGYAGGELQGRPARTLYGSDAEYARLGERVQSAFAAHGTFDGDVCFVRKDGSPIWARVQGRKVRSEALGGGTVWMLEDITAAREAQYQQAWELTHDALTQLHNRSAFDHRLALLLAERLARTRMLGAAGMAGDDAPDDGVVLFLDLDHFTLVNDVAGHDAGDDVLRHVARLIETQVRQVGWAARLGGDEFAVVLPGCPLARGQAVAEQLRATVQAWEPSYQGRSFTLGVSIGLVVLDASLHDVASVLYAADMACYDAKRAGRNRVETRHARDMTSSGRMALGPY